jgi:hypothetical protein
MIKRTIVGVLLALCLADAYGQSQADKPAASQESVRRLLELSEGSKIGIQVVEQLIPAFQKLAPQVPETVWQELRSEVLEEFKRGGVEDVLVPIYTKYFNEDEVRQLIAFYESPVGRKLVSVQPKLVQDSFEAGQQLGREWAKRLAEKLKKRGYSVPIT